MKLLSCLDRPVRRLLILKGTYLLRYTSEGEGGNTGMPVEIVPDSFNISPTNTCAFQVHSLHQTYEYTCGSEEEVKEWIEAFKFVVDRAERKEPLTEVLYIFLLCQISTSGFRTFGLICPLSHALLIVRSTHEYDEQAEGDAVYGYRHCLKMQWEGLFFQCV
jgi:hypothetical protein